ncbi:TolC family protein, partial [Candidatus Cloacimonadota bacterium]
LESSYDIQQQEVTYKNYRSYLTSSWLGLLPTATVSASRINQETYVYDDNLIAVGRERDWSNSAGFSLTKSISLNESSYYNIRRSILDKKSAELSYTDMEKAVAFNVFSRYLYVLESEKNLSIQQENLKLQQKIYDQIQVQYQTGEKSLLELKQSEISLIDYEIAVNEAENSLIQKRQDLFSYLNMTDAGYELTEPEFMIREEPMNYQDNNTLYKKRNSIKSSKLSNFQQLMDFLPTLSLGYHYYTNSTTEDLADFDRYDDSYTISLTASYSIFDIFEKRESFLRSRRDLRIQELDLSISEKDLKETLSNLESDMRTLRRSRDLYSEKLELAKSNLEMAQEQFRLGMISILDLDKAKLDYQNAQLSYNNRYYELIRKQEEINQTLSLPILGKW